MRVENLEEYLCNSIGLYYIIIDNITYNDKKIAILNTELSDLLKNIQKVDFNQKLYEDTSQFLLESKKLSVFDENGSLNFNNGNFLDNKLFFSAVAETPIQATVRFDFTFNSENSFSGKIMIDEYATIDAKGKKNVNL
jgi:hypothetical protein